MFWIFHDANQHWVQMDYIVEHEIYFIHHFYDLMYKDVLDISRCKSALGSNGLIALLGL